MRVAMSLAALILLCIGPLVGKAAATSVTIPLSMEATCPRYPL